MSHPMSRDEHAIWEAGQYDAWCEARAKEETAAGTNPDRCAAPIYAGHGDGGPCFLLADHDGPCDYGAGFPTGSIRPPDEGWEPPF